MSPENTTVLIVDDEPDVRAYLAAVLQHRGYAVVTADAAQSGMALVEQFKPDVICLDIVMPRESGISLYRQLRENERYCHIPVVIISGVASAQEFEFREYVPDLAIAEPDDYLEKPIAVDRFLEVMQRLVARSPSPRQSESTRDATH